MTKTQRRYVDDVVHFSWRVCETCIRHEAPIQYGTEIEFEDSSSKHGGVPWLEMLMVPSGDSIRIAMLPIETSWILGQSQNLEKCRVPPFLGETHMRVSDLRGFVRGKISRLRSAQLLRNDLAAALANEYLLWHRFGYLIHHIRKLWLENSGDGQMGKVARETFDASVRLDFSAHDLKHIWLPYGQ